MFVFFKRKKEVESLKEEVRESFSHVKTDFNKVAEWIKHLDGKDKSRDKEIEEIKDQISSLKSGLEEIKELISVFKPHLSRGLFKQSKQLFNKQVEAVGVQTVVQTAVQTDFLDKLTVMERAIIWALLNSDMKLSYEDLAALLGKDKSTIRGQINTLKQKAGEIIQESREINGKKRLFIPENVQSKILKSVKVKVKEEKEASKSKSES